MAEIRDDGSGDFNVMLNMFMVKRTINIIYDMLRYGIDEATKEYGPEEVQATLEFVQALDNCAERRKQELLAYNMRLKQDAQVH